MTGINPSKYNKNKYVIVDEEGKVVETCRTKMFAENRIIELTRKDQYRKLSIKPF